MSKGRSKGLVALGLVISIETLINMDLLLPVYLRSTGASMLFIGSIYSLGGIISLFVRTPSGVLSDKFGRKPFILFSGMLKSLGALILSISNKLSHITYAFLIRSSGLGMEDPAYLSLISEKSDLAHLGMTFGLILTLQRIPKMVGPILTGAIAEIVDMRYLFMLNAALCLIAVVVIFFLLKKDERVQIEDKIFDLGSIRSFDKNILRFYLAMLFYFLARACFVPFFSIFAKEQGLSIYELGLIMSIGQFIGIFSRVASGWFTDRVGSKKVLLFTGVVRGLSYLAVPFASGFSQLAIAFVPYYSSMAAPPRNTMLSKLSDKASYGKIFGAMSTIMGLADVVGAFLLGVLAQELSLKASFFGMVALEVVFIALLILVKE